MPTHAPSTSSNFNITVNGISFSVRALVTNTEPDASGIYTQRTFIVDDPPYWYYFRVPVAGRSTAYYFLTNSWSGEDVAREQDFPGGGSSFQLFGLHYDGHSWSENADGDLQVSYHSNYECPSSAIVIFACSKSQVQTTSFVESPTCVCKFFA